MNKLLEKWYKYAKADLEAAEILVAHPKSHYSCQLSVLHCHQAIEKILKTLIISQSHEPKRTHNLIFLFQESKIGLPKELIEYIEKLNPHYQPARYPDIPYKGPTLKYNIKIAKEHLSKTKKLFKCIEKILIQ